MSAGREGALGGPVSRAAPVASCPLAPPPAAVAINNATINSRSAFIAFLLQVAREAGCEAWRDAVHYWKLASLRYSLGIPAFSMTPAHFSMSRAMRAPIS